MLAWATQAGTDLNSSIQDHDADGGPDVHADSISWVIFRIASASSYDGDV